MLGLDIGKNSNYGKIVKIVMHGDNDENDKNRNWTMSFESQQRKKSFLGCFEHPVFGCWQRTK